MIEELFEIREINSNTEPVKCKIIEEDNHIKITTIGDTRFNCLNNAEPIDLYGLSMSGKSYCFLNCRIQSSFFRAIPGSTFVCDEYVQERYKNAKQFSKDIMVKRINYYNDEILYQSFYNNSLSIINGDHEYTIHATDKLDQPLCRLEVCDNVFDISTRTCYSYKKSKGLLLSPDTHLVVDFQSSLSLDEVKYVVEILDSVMYCLTTTKTRCNMFYFYDTDNNGFAYHKVEPAVEKDDYFLLDIIKQEAFGKVANVLFSLTNAARNAYFPILRFEHKSFVELQFLEYYRALEYMVKYDNGNMQKKVLEPFIEKYPIIVNFYYKNKDHYEIEEELRNLRNYYSHAGYIIDNLRIPTDLTKPERRNIVVTLSFIFTAKEFVKACFFKEFYDRCNVNISEDHIINYLRRF